MPWDRDDRPGFSGIEEEAPRAGDSSSKSSESDKPAIVLKAASIIEEEIALGIGAVKRIEQRLLNVEALRAQPPDAVMARLRRDAHEAVDIVLDVVQVAVATLGETMDRVVTVAAETSSRPTPPGMRIPALRVPDTTPAGGTAELTMALENESDRGTAEFTLHSSDLVTATGARIPAECVTFAPQTLVVEPRSSGHVVVRIAVPSGLPPGTYEGLVRASRLDQLRAMLVIQVG